MLASCRTGFLFGVTFLLFLFLSFLKHKDCDGEMAAVLVSCNAPIFIPRFLFLFPPPRVRAGSFLLLVRLVRSDFLCSRLPVRDATRVGLEGCMRGGNGYEKVGGGGVCWCTNIPV